MASDFNPATNLTVNGEEAYTLEISFTTGSDTSLEPETVDNGVVNGVRQFEVRLDPERGFNNNGEIQETVSNFTISSEDTYEVVVKEFENQQWVVKGSGGGKFADATEQ